MPLYLFLEKLHPTPEGAQTDTRLTYTRFSSVTTGTAVGLVGGRASVERWKLCASPITGTQSYGL